MQITGIVLDIKSNKPIPFANIIVEGTNRKVSADSKGIFSLSVYRTDTVIVASFGYEERAFLLDNNSDNSDNIFIRVFLNPNINMLQNVVIWGITKENFKEAFVNQKIKKENIQELKLTIANKRVYQVPASVGVKIGLEDLIRSLPLVNDIKNNIMNERRHKDLMRRESGNIPKLDVD